MLDIFEQSKTLLSEEIKYWADYLFHFTDMKNALKILECERVFCRWVVVDQNLMQSDNASQKIIEQTYEGVKNYARFYFRPQTSTQYQIEGLRADMSKDAHCPKPVFFCSATILLKNIKIVVLFQRKLWLHLFQFMKLLKTI